MTTKNELEIWQKAINYHKAGNQTASIKEFSKIADSSKIHFNISQLDSSQEGSLLSVNRALTCDSHMAISYYIRAQINFNSRNYQLALLDYNSTLTQLKSNTFIDYTQLGLEFILKLQHVYYNIALCNHKLGLDSYFMLRKAAKIDESISMDMIDHGQIYFIQKNLLFEPNEYKINNLEKVDYLGSSRVIAKADFIDLYVDIGTLVREKSVKREQTGPRVIPTANFIDSYNDTAVKESSPKAVAIADFIELYNDIPVPVRKESSLKIGQRKDSANEASPTIASLYDLNIYDRVESSQVPSATGLLIPTRKSSVSNSLIKTSLSSSVERKQSQDKQSSKIRLQNEWKPPSSKDDVRMVSLNRCSLAELQGKIA